MNRLAFATSALLGVAALVVIGTRSASSGAADAIVRLQSTSPGVAQIGHTNITGTSIAGQFQGGGAGLTNVAASTLNVPMFVGSSQPTFALLYLSNTGTTARSDGIEVSTNSAFPFSTGVLGQTNASTGTVFGVWGNTLSDSGYGVYGSASNNFGSPAGVFGETTGTAGAGVFGRSQFLGVNGVALAANGTGVQGIANSTGATGVLGTTSSVSAYGMRASNSAASGQAIAFRADSPSTQGVGVLALSQGTGVLAQGTGPGATAVVGQAFYTQGTGVYGSTSSTSGTGVFGFTNNTTSIAMRAANTATTGDAIALRADTSSVAGIGVESNSPFVAFLGITNVATGTGVHSQNTASGDDVTLTGANGAINTNGFLYREYTVSTRSNAIPIAYGTINSVGTILSGTGNFTCALAANVFTIAVASENISQTSCTCMVTPVASGSPRMGTWAPSAGGDLEVRIWSTAGVLAPTNFSFVLYKSAPTADGGGGMDSEMSFGKPIIRNGNLARVSGSKRP